jgi:hypothetical protein
MVAQAGCFDLKDPDAMRQAMSVMGPQHLDQMIRQAISMCWLFLPEENRSVAAEIAPLARLAPILNYRLHRGSVH